MELIKAQNFNIDDIIVVPGSFKFSKEKFIKGLEGIVEEYKKLIVTDDSIPAYKKEVANLRKFSKAIDDFRKDKKAVYLKPLEEFERDIKDITGEVDKCINHLTSQLDQFELERKEKKRDEILKIAALFKNEYSLEEIGFKFDYKKEWLNKTKKISEIKEEMVEQINSYIEAKKQEQELEKAKQQKKEFLETLLETFQEQYQLENKIRYTEVEMFLDLDTSEMKEALKELFEQRKTNEIEFKKYKEREKEKKTVKREASLTKTVTIKFEHLPLAQANKLMSFIQENNINYEVLE